VTCDRWRLGEVRTIGYVTANQIERNGSSILGLRGVAGPDQATTVDYSTIALSGCGGFLSVTPDSARSVRTAKSYLHRALTGLVQQTVQIVASRYY